MKNARNSISKGKYFMDYKFPRSTRDKAIIEASETGCGFKTKYEDKWESVVSSEEFARRIQQVEFVH